MSASLGRVADTHRRVPETQRSPAATLRRVAETQGRVVDTLRRGRPSLRCPGAGHPRVGAGQGRVSGYPFVPRFGASMGRGDPREGGGIPFMPHAGALAGGDKARRGGKTLRYPGAGIRGGAARQGRGWARAPDPPGPPWQGGIALGQRHALCLHVGVPGRLLPPLTRGGPGRGWTRGERRLVPGAGFAPYPAPKKHPAHQSVRGESENGSRLGARPAQPGGGGRSGDGCDDAIKICPRLSRGCLD